MAPSREPIATIATTTTTAWRNAVMGLFALGGVAVSTWGPRLPAIRESLHLGDGVVGLALAGVAVGSVLGLVASSPLQGRLGPRRAIAGALLLIACGIAVVAIGAGIAASLPVTLVGFVAAGFGIGALDVMINVQGSAIEKTTEKTVMPMLHAAWSAGAILGSGIGAGAAALRIDFPWQFLGEALGIAVLGVVCVQFLPAGPVDPEPVVRRPVGVRLREWAGGWSDWRLLMIGLVMLGVELGEGTSNSWLTLAVRDGHHQTDAVAALFFTAFAIGETGARVLGGPLVDRIGRVKTVRFTTAIGVAGLLLFILGGPAWVVLVGTVLWAVGVSMGFPLGMSAAADSGPNPAARVSVVASIGYLANLGGPPVIGALSEAVGLLNALWLVVALLAIGFLAAGALRARQVGRVGQGPSAR
ncbi:MFS transporter [Frondihabitans sucicola]|uniref:MFS transporter n=1 Tax=Frondihabitans sucicola TaxID=1268041 RepID=A0ABN6Y1Y3_9MICO|nr:MFS transporter [Frondihabitans sucicola]BDZ51344.1 MFS transporter [Frondihabitans sucicola]